MDDSTIGLCVGPLVLGLFAWSLYGVWRHRRPDGPLDRGLKLWSAELDPSLAADLADVEETTGDWGWLRREGDVLLVFSDPYRDIERHMRLETPWPYVARVDLAAGGIEYRVPTGMGVCLGLGLLPLAALLAPMNHAMQAGRIGDRLRQLAQDGKRATQQR